MGFRLVSGVWLAICLSLQASADVVDAAPSGFHLRITHTVDASADRLYDTLIDVAAWWDGNHSWFGSAEGFSLTPEAGGCLCETRDGRSALHMTVSYVDPGHELHLSGGLGPLRTLGLTGQMSFRLKAVSATKTTLVHEYRVTGYSKDGLEGLADIVDRVQQGQMKRLVAHAVARAKKVD
ncbi:MAG: SRPBCC domain-containing protein [Pseudomonadota bacterium]